MLRSPVPIGIGHALAVAVHEWVGLTILRRAWVNLDLLWAPALIVAGGVMVIL